MISVIIPTHNRRALLEQTLTSVYAQTLEPDEIIVADDGSTDDTQTYLRRQPVTAIELPHSGRPAPARNAGLDQARGDLVAFLDSDDVWMPTALAHLCAALNSTPQAGFAFCDYADGLSEPASRPSYADGALVDIFEPLLQSDFLATGALLIRRDAIRAVGRFDEGCRVADDWDYWLRLASRFEGVYVNRPLLRVRAQSDSISRAPGGALFADNIRISRKMIRLCRSRRRQSLDLAASIHRRSLYESARYHWHHRQFAPAIAAVLGIVLPVR